MNCCGCTQLNYVERTQQTISDLQKLLDAKKLLDNVLSYLNTETLTFRFLDEKIYQRELKRLSPEAQKRSKRDSERLREKIEDYVYKRVEDDSY